MAGGIISHLAITQIQYERMHYMYKMIYVYDVITDKNNCIESAKYSIIHKGFRRFGINEKTEAKLIKYCKMNDYDDGKYTIVKYRFNKPVEVVGRFAYYPNEIDLETYLDIAEWNTRIEASVALGVDIEMSKATKRQIKKFENLSRKAELRGERLILIFNGKGKLVPKYEKISEDNNSEE